MCAKISTYMTNQLVLGMHFAESGTSDDQMCHVSLPGMVCIIFLA